MLFVGQSQQHRVCLISESEPAKKKELTPKLGIILKLSKLKGLVPLMKDPPLNNSNSFHFALPCLLSKEGRSMDIAFTYAGRTSLQFAC